MSLRSTIRWVNTRYFDSLFLGSNFSLFLFSLFPPAFFSFFIPFSTSPYSSHLFFYSLTRPPHFPLSPHLPYSFLYICFTSSFAWWFFPIFVFFFFFISPPPPYIFLHISFYWLPLKRLKTDCCRHLACTESQWREMYCTFLSVSFLPKVPVCLPRS